MRRGRSVVLSPRANADGEGHLREIRTHRVHRRLEGVKPPIEPRFQPVESRFQPVEPIQDRESSPSILDPRRESSPSILDPRRDSTPSIRVSVPTSRVSSRSILRSSASKRPLASHARRAPTTATTAALIDVPRRSISLAFSLGEAHHRDPSRLARGSDGVVAGPASESTPIPDPISAIDGGRRRDHGSSSPTDEAPCQGSSHPMPLRSPSKLWGSGGRTANFRSSTSEQSRSGGGGGMQASG